MRRASRGSWVVVLLATGCFDATPYGEDAAGGGGSPDAAVDADEPADGGGQGDGGSQGDAAEPHRNECLIEGAEDVGRGEYVIQIYNPTCASGVCLYTDSERFCTHRCGADEECLDVGGGRCELHITTGDPLIVGDYCVVASASPY